MTTTLIIARHGNTFEAGQTPTRVGGRTDIPLTIEGRAQSQRLGAHLKSMNIVPDVLFTSRLQRTIETGYLAMQTIGRTVTMRPFTMFDEIDYGPDENKTEAEVIARIGQDAIADWDQNAIPPEGWIVDPEKIKQDWISFGEDMLREYPDETIFVVTSNGIARFAPHLAGNFDQFKTDNKLKLSTGAFSILTHDGNAWHITEWNTKPAK